MIFVSPKHQQKNCGEGIRSNVYSLGVILLFAGLPEGFIFLFLFVEFIPYWRVIKCRHHDDCFIIIANNVLVAVKWQIKLSN